MLSKALNVTNFSDLFMTHPIICPLRFPNTQGKRSIPTLCGPPSDWLIKEKGTSCECEQTLMGRKGRWAQRTFAKEVILIS